MNVLNCVKVWFNGILKPDETAKNLTKKKLKMKDGIISVGILGLIIGVIFSIIIAASGFFNPASIILTLIMFPLTFAILLMVFSGLFRIVASHFGGKGKMPETAGFFGLYAGMMSLAMLPTIAMNVFSILAVSSEMLAMLIISFGILITAALSGILSGLMYEVLSFNEKAKLPKIGLIYGIASGTAVVALMIFSNIMAEMLPMLM